MLYITVLVRQNNEPAYLRVLAARSVINQRGIALRGKNSVFSVPINTRLASRQQKSTDAARKSRTIRYTATEDGVRKRIIMRKRRFIKSRFLRYLPSTSRLTKNNRLERDITTVVI